MFFDNKLMNSNTLKHAWRAANQQAVDKKNLPIPKICTTLDSWISSEYMDPSRRLSLRTSSILVDGTAKLYQQGLRDLVKDVFELEYQMITRKRPREDNSEEFDARSPVLEQSEDTPGHSAVGHDTSDSQRGRLVENDTNSRIHRSKRSKHNDKSKRTISSSSSRSEDLTEELPVGQILVYENPRSLLPSKIIVGHINPGVKKNIVFRKRTDRD